MTGTMDTATAFEIVRSGKIGRLGCIDNGEPYVVPINYVESDGHVYTHSLPGKKVRAMKINPRVCLQVDEIQDEFHWRSAIAFGNFEEILDEEEQRVVIAKLFSRFPVLTPVESLIAEDVAAPNFIVFRIVVDRVTGFEET